MSDSSGERVDTQHSTKSAWHKWVRESVQKYTYQNKMNVPDGIIYHSAFKLPNKEERDAETAIIKVLHQNQGPIWGQSALLRGLGAPLCPVNEAISQSFTGYQEYISSIFQLPLMCLWQLTFWGWGGYLLVRLLSLFMWTTGQVRDKLWPKCQFQFHLHCMFLFQNWWLSRYIYTLYKHAKVESQAFFPLPLSLDCFFLIKIALKQSYFLSQLDEMNENIPEDNTFTPRAGNNLIFSELIRLKRVTRSRVCTWKRHLPRFINQQTFLYLKEWLKTPF